MPAPTPESGPTLLYLHGIGNGDPARSWHAPLESTLVRLNFPDLATTTVVAPHYAALLAGGPVDRTGSRPAKSPPPAGADLAALRREYDTRITRLENLIGRHNSGRVVGFSDGGAATLVRLRQTSIAQATRFVSEADRRGAITTQILDELGDADDLVIVAHSLGTLVALNLLDHLPPGVRVRRLVTIGSPLGFPALSRWKPFPDGFPYWRVESWVNVWNAADPVSLGRGITRHFPDALDLRISGTSPIVAHFSATFARSEQVALTIGDALFGSPVKTLAPLENSLAVDLKDHEMALALRLSYAHCLAGRSEKKTRRRAEAAINKIQVELMERLVDHYQLNSLPIPSVLAECRDGSRPHPLPRLSREESIIPLISMSSINPFAPFEIAFPAAVTKRAFEDLALSIGQSGVVGEAVHSALGEARKLLNGRSDNRLLWGAAAVAILAAGPVAWAVAAPAGLAGGAAIVGGLAAFGPGGMAGGIATIGALTSLGTGAATQALREAPVEAVEESVAQLLARAIARTKLKLDVVPDVWQVLCEMESELSATLAHLVPYSDPKSASISDLREKLSAIDKALSYLIRHGLAPWPTDESDEQLSPLQSQAILNLLEKTATKELLNQRPVQLRRAQTSPGD